MNKIMNLLSFTLTLCLIVPAAFAAPKGDNKSIKKTAVSKTRQKAIGKKLTQKDRKNIKRLIKKNKKNSKLKKFKFKKLTTDKARKTRIKKMDAAMRSASANFDQNQKAAFKVWSELSASEKDAVVSSQGKMSLGYYPAVALAIGVANLVVGVVRENERENERGGESETKTGTEADALNNALDF